MVHAEPPLIGQSRRTRCTYQSRNPPCSKQLAAPRPAAFACTRRRRRAPRLPSAAARSGREAHGTANRLSLSHFQSRHHHLLLRQLAARWCEQHRRRQQEDPPLRSARLLTDSRRRRRMSCWMIRRFRQPRRPKIRRHLRRRRQHPPCDAGRGAARAKRRSEGRRGERLNSCVLHWAICHLNGPFYRASLRN